MFAICAEKFFDFALKLFAKAGHTDVVEPELKNHSAKQFIYFDCDKNLSLSQKQRRTINFFDNISRLFTFQEIAIFSLNLTVINIFARKYYFSDSAPTFYDLVPINFFADITFSNTRSELEEILIDQKFSAVKVYGNDYVEYDKILPKDFVDNEYELDLILQEAENIQLNLDFNEENLSQTESISDNLSEIDTKIFDDPERLLNYVENLSEIND